MSVKHLPSLQSLFEAECLGYECIVTLGYNSPGDGGGGLYIPSPIEPTHDGKAQSLDGSWWELSDLRPNILQFGGVDDGIATDDTMSFDSLASYSNDKQLCAFIPPTRFGFATNGGHFFHYGLCADGNGYGSTIHITHATNHVITSVFNAGAPFKGIKYQAAVNRTAGATLFIDAPEGTVCYKTEISDNIFSGGFWDILLNRATVATVEDNFSVDFKSSFLVIKNVDFPDNGDHNIEGNVWDSSIASAGPGIVQYNAGGARISNNKGGRGAFAYELVLTGTAAQSTSVLTFSNNSFENQIHGCIRLRRYASSTATFGKVVIDGNELSSNVLDNPCIQIDDGSGFIEDIVVTDNIIQFPVVGISSTAAKKFMISGNTLRSFNGSSVGISCGVNSSGTIDKNTFHNITTPISNASPNVIVT